MKKVLVFAFAAVSVGSFAQTLWYNGDADGVNGLASERNTIVSDARTYDNFMSGTGWVVNTVWGNFLVSALSSTQLYYDIRRGVSANNGGTSVADGTVASRITPTSRSAFGLNEEQHLAAISSVSLANNTEYWLAVAPISTSQGAGRAYVSTTDGADRGPSHDPNPAPIGFRPGGSFFDSTYFGYNFEPTVNLLGVDADFSLGVGGVPEPASMIVLGGALAALAARRRRK